MSLLIDSKYISLLSSRLELFKSKGEYLWNFRCPYCGDSKTKTTKSRGYIYRKSNDLFYKCHNCNLGTTFSKFIQKIDPVLYTQYITEKFLDNPTLHKNYKKPKLPKEVLEERITKKKDIVLLDSIQSLDDKHWAKEWVMNRQIPSEYWSDLYFAPDFKNFIKTSYGESKSNGLIEKDPRLVIPFYDKNGSLTHIQGRSLQNNKLRYITIKLKEGAPKIYGLDKVNFGSTVYIVEGPIDSMFLENSIAAGGGDLRSVANLIKDGVYVFDNEPWNKQICTSLMRLIEDGKKVFIWPTYITIKDINDAYLAGLDIQNIIKENTYSGLDAYAKYSFWKSKFDS